VRTGISPNSLRARPRRRSADPQAVRGTAVIATGGRASFRRPSGRSCTCNRSRRNPVSRNSGPGHGKTTWSGRRDFRTPQEPGCSAFWLTRPRSKPARRWFLPRDLREKILPSSGRFIRHETTCSRRGCRPARREGTIRNCAPRLHARSQRLSNAFIILDEAQKHHARSR